jgi:integrase
MAEGGGLMALASARLEDAMLEWETDMRLKRKAAGTIRRRRVRMRQLLNSTGNVYVKNLTAAHFNKVFEVHDNWTDRTRLSVIGDYSVFLKWAARKRYVSDRHDLLEEWRGIRVAQEPRNRVPVSDFAALLDAAPNPRDRILVAILLYLLVRQGEATQIKWGDIDLGGDEPTVKIFRPKTKDHDKVAICEELHDELLTWRNYVCKKMGVTSPSRDWYVICLTLSEVTERDDFGRFKGSPQRTTVNPMKPLLRLDPRVKVILKAIGFPVAKEGGHTLRRSGALALFNQLCQSEGLARDEALLIVSSTLGHSDVRQTLRYLGLETYRMRRNEILSMRPMYGRRTGGPTANVLPLRRVLAGGEEGSARV